jgi:UDP-N-acetylmuramoyl-tripeptide--D-alanyl-D-alanine ligase
MFTDSLNAVASVTRGMLLQGNGTLPVRGIFTDTRQPIPGGLFLALKGERFDGHDYLDVARCGGAAAVMVSQMDSAERLDSASGLAVILVPDTRQAYLDMAKSYRLKLDHVRWFGVTGSAGKTSVKEMLASILGHGAGWKVHRAEKSYNNEIGLPATVLAADVTHRAVILELGTNHPGEIARLASVARPHIAILNNAGPSHLEAFHTVANVAEEKSHIFDHLGAGGAAILNADDTHFDDWRSRLTGRVLTFGSRREADVRAEAIEERPGKGAHFYLCIGTRAEAIQLRVPGRHNVNNAMAAAAAALAAYVPVDAIRDGLCAYHGTERRFQVTEHDGVLIVDDAYNASPLSFRAALETLQEFAGHRIFVVAGDMLELGERTDFFHEELGKWLAQTAPHALLTVGPWAGRAGCAAVQSGLPPTAWMPCSSPEEAASRLRPQLVSGDVVLVKGSHGMKLERCVKRLAERTPMALAGS